MGIFDILLGNVTTTITTTSTTTEFELFPERSDPPSIYEVVTTTTATTSTTQSLQINLDGCGKWMVIAIITLVAFCLLGVVFALIYCKLRRSRTQPHIPMQEIASVSRSNPNVQVSQAGTSLDYRVRPPAPLLPPPTRRSDPVVVNISNVSASGGIERNMVSFRKSAKDKEK